MILRIAGKIVSVFVSLLVISVAIFLILEWLPGDPASIQLGTVARDDTLAALRLQMGLNQPLFWRYFTWMSGVFLRGDLGTSLFYHIPVSTLVLERLWVTLPLTLMAIVLAVLLGIGGGTVAAFYRNSVFDHFCRILSHVGLAVPNFCLGLFLILLVSSGLGWLPTGGFPGWSEGFLSALLALVLPAFTLASALSAVLFRVSRSVMVEVIRADFVRTAFAKGVSRFRIMWRHALPNSLHPILTVLGLQISLLIAGTVLVEGVFDLPGMGQLALNAMMNRDLVVTRALALILGGAVIVINGLIDLAQIMLDPRLRGQK